jgi:hypothetical protein
MREEIIVETCEEERRENGMFYNLITHRKSTVFSKRFLIAISFSIFRKNLKKTTQKKTHIRSLKFNQHQRESTVFPTFDVG